MKDPTFAIATIRLAAINASIPSALAELMIVNLMLPGLTHEGTVACLLYRGLTRDELEEWDIDTSHMGPHDNRPNADELCDTRR